MDPEYILRTRRYFVDIRAVRDMRHELVWSIANCEFFNCEIADRRLAHVELDSAIL